MKDSTQLMIVAGMILAGIAWAAICRIVQDYGESKARIDELVDAGVLQ